MHATSGVQNCANATEHASTRSMRQSMQHWLSCEQESVERLAASSVGVHPHNLCHEL